MAVTCNGKTLVRKDLLSQSRQKSGNLKIVLKDLHNFAMWLTTVSNSQFLNRSAIWEQQLKAKFMIRSRLLPETLVYSNAHYNQKISCASAYIWYYCKREICSV